MRKNWGYLATGPMRFLIYLHHNKSTEELQTDLDLYFVEPDQGINYLKRLSLYNRASSKLAK